MNDALVPVLIVAGVAVLGLVMRYASRGDSSAAGGAGSGEGGAEIEESPIEGGDDGESDDDAPHPNAHAPVTSDGVALLRMGSQVRLMPTDPEAHAAHPAPAGGEGDAPRSRHRDPQGAPGLVLHAGDFTAARVRREPGEGWRVETLGRDGEFGLLTFDTEAVAHEALALLERAGVLRRPLDEDGEPAAPSAEDFEEARRRFEETERALALDTGDDEPPAPNDWSSRR